MGVGAGESGPVLASYLIGAALIAGISWLDDIRTLPSWVRLATHSLGAALAIAGCGAWDTVTLPITGPVALGGLGTIVTFLWIVGLTNAYNFMDGIDGIAGSQAAVAGIGWALIGGSAGQPLILMLGLLVAATALGFLRHNWSPARIFMGDVGSTFLGYTFATLPLLARCGCPHPELSALAGGGIASGLAVRI